MRFIKSLDRRRVATIVVVGLVAFLTGHFMQTVLAETNPVASITDGPDAAPVLRSIEEPRPLPTPPAATLVPILRRPPVMPDRVDEYAALSPAAPKPVPVSCDPALELRAAPAATLQIVVTAPCAPSSPVLVRHGPLSTTETTDDKGRLVHSFPTRRSSDLKSVV